MILDIDRPIVHDSPGESFDPTYHIPSLRLIETTTEQFFLASNLEPIGGGDDPDIDW